MLAIHPWQQIVTKDLVSFTLVGEPKSLGGSGGLLIDDHGDMVAYSVLEVSEQAQNEHKVLEVSMWRTGARDFYQPANSWEKVGGFTQSGGGDPVIWKVRLLGHTQPLGWPPVRGGRHPP